MAEHTEECEDPLGGDCHCWYRGEIAELTAKLEAAEKDAERYRWLRDDAESADWEFIGYQDSHHTDDIIDDAMGKNNA